MVWDWDQRDSDMTGTYVQASERVRRLYCLECGEGSYVPLPASWFVETHEKKHELEKDEVNDNFMVVERPKNDKTIRLTENLSSLFYNDSLEWSGAITAEVAEKYGRRNA